ncbi:hypothetical protein CAPTEDRAFT_157089 [Capitella teleta]|uniref:BTB domain-containing protein n=1 Tax=Capitella teleta TaxID=283909 RepID=R7UUQ3_CAPTE|nr:hypothetical protein CAPTEDRAFT_157089 [Capitella teleta]|eukprot:ELU09920.1 hypothetical protein CAPTEDRAFT_157089 [Capitella teleta]
MNGIDADDSDDQLGWVSHANEDKVIINVGGQRHETLVSSLVAKPNTRLGRLAMKHKPGVKEEYFFDRHPEVFSAIMDFYRSGELHVPLSVCGAVFKRELDFWMIDDCFIEACCWTSYSSYIDNQKTLREFTASVSQENQELEMVAALTGWQKRQMKIWLILDHPRSSNLALAYAIISFLFVLASITGFCIETLPDVHYSVPDLNPINSTKMCGNIVPSKDGMYIKVSNPYLEYLDYICTAFFTIELIVRIIFAPSKINFLRSIMNIIDILALLPLYVQIMLDITDRQNCLQHQRAVVETIFILRIIRIFRIFHLVKHYKALKILVHAIKASIQELLMLAIFLFIAMLVLSTLIFYAERREINPLDPDAEGVIDTIPLGLWWSIITMTTVGYGDVHPTTAFGCVIGAMCALCGVLLLALTIPVISNNFALFYLHARTREQIAEKDITAKERLAQAKTRLKVKAGGALPSGSQENIKKRGPDSKLLLCQQDSNSTTDECSMMLSQRQEADFRVRPSEQRQQMQGEEEETVM